MIFERVFISCRLSRNPDISEISYFEHFVLVLLTEFFEFLEFLLFEFDLGNLLNDFKGALIAHKRNYLIP